MSAALMMTVFGGAHLTFAQTAATTPQARGLSLARAIELALQHNFDVQSARFAIDSSQAERQIARAVPNPSYVASPNTPYQYGASIPLDVGPQRLYRNRAATLGAAAAKVDARDIARTVTLSVQRAFYDVLLS
ncbi:MAG: TolC family protein, partial [Gemmatimonadota bacterium]|nr:TolC family protein [Gemmatimonadota bacterium]